MLSRFLSKPRMQSEETAEMRNVASSLGAIRDDMNNSRQYFSYKGKLTQPNPQIDTAISAIDEALHHLNKNLSNKN